MKKFLFFVNTLLSFNNGIILYFASSYGLGNNLIEISVLRSLYPNKLIITFTPCQDILSKKNMVFLEKYL